MSRYHHSFIRLFVGLLLGALASFQPLSAQLDPKLQASKTDFLNLYQASTTTKVKPEILTVLDFSGSMSYLMFHPLYVNSDSADNGGTSAMSFSLSGGNKYTIKATAAAKSTTWASLDATVGGGTSNPQNNGTHSGYTMSNVTTAATSFVAGASYTFYASVTAGTNKSVNWTVSGGTIVSSSNTQMVWKAPALAPYVVNASISGGTVGTLSSSKLIRPNGDIVTESDAALGSWAGGSGEIMNWVQSASHARFQYTDGSTLRTVDIPMPWKITNRDSTGHPLSSQTVLDPLTKNGLPYGSGNQIEMDQNYSNSFNGSGTSTTLQTNHVNYKTAYIDWLFTGKYANGTYTGKYIVFDAENASLVGGQDLNTWGRGYGISATSWGTSTFYVPQFNLDGSYSGEALKDASVNVVPALTRVQAVKRAVIQTWIMFQQDVLWAFRFLDPSGEASSGSATTIDNVSTTNATTSGWALLNGSSVTNMNYIAARPPSGNTPLTYAMSRSLAQFTDPSSVFNSQYTSSNPASQCMRHYLILFTDGLDNNGQSPLNGNGTTPYLVKDAATSKITIDAAAGNNTILATPSLVDRYGTNWNLFTFAGLGAHMADPSLGAVNTYYKTAVLPAPSSGNPSAFLPFAIKARNGVTFSNDHRVTTMTVGVSLGGQYTDTSSPKRSLFLAAALGDPTLVYCKDLALITPFVWEADPKDPLNFPDVGRKKANTIFFFDGVSPDALTDSLSNALKSAVGDLTTNATSNPNLPFVGASFGKQIYTGTFQPPKTGGAVWGGDMLMFGTKEVNGQTTITDKAGNQATVLDNSTSQWSAKDALYSAKLWSSRRLYTRIPGGTALKPFTDVGADYTDSTTGLQKYVATGLPRLTPANLAAIQAVVQFAAGAETVKGPFDSVTGRPTANRANIMGDIINSAPAALEYNWNDVKNSLGPYSRLTAQVAKGGNRFRLIMVGTNQGWVHAFGEVTMNTIVKVNGVDQEIVTGDVQELWAFMPTDFLANLDYITVQGNSHRFMADGTPALYHLDLPPSSGGSGNGLVDSTERAVAIFGLRKGGRSYYALDIHDPFTPSLKWSLVPDESSNTLVKNMGFSTCTPAFGRVSSSDIIRDAVFLGGGYSNAETESNFAGTKLGRSVFALDVNTGEILASADLTAASIGGSTVGSIPAGVIPFEFFLNSGMAQRAYFLDYKGGLWSWGSKSVGTAAPYVNYRQDTSDLTAWSIRKVSQDDNADLGARYTTLPAPFRVGSFPGVGKTGSAPPAAVGVAMVSGDRNNPLDELYNTTTDVIPVRHRLTVVFDRQDSRVWNMDSAAGPDTGIKNINLSDFTANNVTSTPATACSDSLFKYITPGCADYYLAPTTGDPKFGYFINFPKIAKGFVPKGINAPIVVANGLFYSYFSPNTADPCTGGSGDTNSWYTTDVMNPIVSDSRSTLAVKSGQKDTWAGVASDYIALGTRGVLQGGAVKVANPQPGASLTTPELHSTQGAVSLRFPKPRVWRTVH